LSIGPRGAALTLAALQLKPIDAPTTDQVAPDPPET
jgi:hypothetical protein